MSVRLEQLPCEFCRDDCPAMDLEIDSMCIYANNKIVERILTLKCRNEELCKYIREREIEDNTAN